MNGIFLPSSFGSSLPYLAQADPSLPLFPAFPSRAVSYHGARIAFKKALELIGADPASSAFFGESIVVSRAFFLLCLTLFLFLRCIVSCLTRAGPDRGPARESELGP